MCSFIINYISLVIFILKDEKRVSIIVLWIPYWVHFSENTPFHISQNELLYSKEESSSYWLYRVYDIDKKVKLEKYRGNLEQYFFFEPINYIASKKNL